MIRTRITRITLVAVGLLLGAAAVSRTTLDASGYLVSCGFHGEASCEPGGSADCVVT